MSGNEWKDWLRGKWRTDVESDWGVQLEPELAN